MNDDAYGDSAHADVNDDAYGDNVILYNDVVDNIKLADDEVTRRACLPGRNLPRPQATRVWRARQPSLKQDSIRYQGFRIRKAAEIRALRYLHAFYVDSFMSIWIST